MLVINELVRAIKAKYPFLPVRIEIWAAFSSYDLHLYVFELIAAHIRLDDMSQAEDMLPYLITKLDKIDQAIRELPPCDETIDPFDVFYLDTATKNGIIDVPDRDTILMQIRDKYPNTVHYLVHNVRYNNLTYYVSYYAKVSLPIEDKRIGYWIEENDYILNIYEFELLERTIRTYRRRKRNVIMVKLAPIFAILPLPIAEELADCYRVA